MRWLSRLLHPFESPGASDAELEKALDRAAERVDPGRLKQARGWPRRFRRPIAAALAQAKRVAQGIPGPVELDTDHYARNPFVHALFASTEDVHRCLRSSAALRDFASLAVFDETYALLSMRREEKHTLGMEEHGGVLRRDVLQQVVWFADHRLIGAAATLAEARDNVTWMLFERFLERLSVGMERLRADKDRLTRDKDLALARLRRADPGRRAESERSLDAVLRQLHDTIESLDVAHLHEVFETVLSHPQDCLFIEDTRLTLDSMGVVHSNGVEPVVPTLSFTELVERYHERRTVVMVHCRNIQSVLLEKRLSDAEPWPF